MRTEHCYFTYSSISSTATFFHKNWGKYYTFWAWSHQWLTCWEFWEDYGVSNMCCWNDGPYTIPESVIGVEADRARVEIFWLMTRTMIIIITHVSVSPISPNQGFHLVWRNHTLLREGVWLCQTRVSPWRNYQRYPYVFPAGHGSSHDFTLPRYLGQGDY